LDLLVLTLPHKITRVFIVAQSGKTVTGLILEETGDAVKVVENPLAKADPVVIKKSDIASRQQSKTSIMPKGVMDKLTREEEELLRKFAQMRGLDVSTRRGVFSKFR